MVVQLFACESFSERADVSCMSSSHTSEWLLVNVDIDRERRSTRPPHLSSNMSDLLDADEHLGAVFITIFENFLQAYFWK